MLSLLLLAKIGKKLVLRPNTAHHALAAMQVAGMCSQLVTQNVDGLHQRAGSVDVIDLHGRLDEAICLQCGARSAREALQARIAADNPGWQAEHAATAPDGDADIDNAAVLRFQPRHCQARGGQVKPDVVFFGENVPRERYRQAHQALQASDAMLVAGSSLMVYSGFRFASMACQAGMRLAILNHGRTRADDLASLKLETDIGATLQAALRM